MIREVSFDFEDAPPIDYANQPVLSLSPQQTAIAEWVETGTGNGLIVAVAGAGKTTTLIEMLSRMRGTVAFAAYNKRIADEIKERVEAQLASSLVKVATFHSFGFSAWRKANPRVQVDANKIRALVRDNPKIPEDLYEFVEKLVSLVRQTGIGILCRINDKERWEWTIAHYGLEDLLLDRGRFGTVGGFGGRKEMEDDEDLQDMIKLGMGFALQTLRKSIEIADEIIDFDDQIYMPIYANVPIDKFDWVLIDEAQDSNPTRRALARAMLKEGGRLLAVGDPAQAIYGFTGADSESLENIKQEFGCVEMGLTVSYRCPQSVVRLAQTWVSHIEAASTADEGSVTGMLEEDFLSLIPALSRSELNHSSVLCRKNAPLVGLAFSLIRQGVVCHVEGRDIGGQIKTLTRKWKRVDSLRDLATKIQEFRRHEVQKFVTKGQETRADAVADKCDTVLTLIDGLLSRDRGATVRDLWKWVDDMFGDNLNRGLTLSSIHKAKGREWETVYWFGANAWQPSPFAIQEWQQIQERNLMYVAATRSKRNLVQVSVPVKARF